LAAEPGFAIAAGGPTAGAPTVGALLAAATAHLRDAGSPTARLDAELLLGEALGLERTALLAHPERPVGVPDAAAFERLVVRRATGEPVAYIRGRKEFLGLILAVDHRVLIPRPETELLVELAEREVVARAPSPSADGPLRIVDVGTGSGAIPVALAVLLGRRGIGPAVELVATDVSPDALAVARGNAATHGVADRIDFVEADLLPSAAAPWDVVLANLPYVRADAIDGLPVATSFEPRLALDGGPDGLGPIRRLLVRLRDALAPGGVALLEIGADQEAGIRETAASILPGWRLDVLPDLAGLPRVARIEHG
jgi:release factor glutamine methyltransferase